MDIAIRCATPRRASPLGRRCSLARRVLSGLVSLTMAGLTSLPALPSVAAADDQSGTTIFLGKYFEKRPDGTTISYIYLGDLLVAAVIHPPSGPPRIQYVHQDHLGSTTLVTDEAGQVVARTEYAPYGATTQQQGSSSVPHQFTGQRLDASTGLHAYGARYYDSHLGRFIQPDPIVQDYSDPQALNRYTYVRNNPVNMVDPSGNFAFLAFLGAMLVKAAIGAAVGAVASVAVGASTGQIHSFKDVGRFAAVGASVGAIGGAGAFALGASGLGLTGIAKGVTDFGTFVGAGAVGGGIDSAMSDGSFGQGALYGAALGGAMYGIGLGFSGFAHTPLGERIGDAAWGALHKVADRYASRAIQGALLDSATAQGAGVSSEVYAGVRQVSAFLKESGLPRNVRKAILGPLDPRTVGMRYAGLNDYGLRYYGGKAAARGHWLFETFPAGRESLAIKFDWNTMAHLKQWRIRPGAPIIYGRVYCSPLRHEPR